MRRRSGLLAAVLLLATGCGGTTTTTGTGSDGSVDGGGTSARQTSGTTLPDVTLPALRSGEKAIDLGSLKGPAVVNLWANWCPPCRKEMPVIERFHQQTPGVRVIGVDSLDTQPELARQVADQAGVTYSLVVDKDQAFTSAGRGLPQTFFVDSRGRIVYVNAGGFSSEAELQALVDKHLPDAGTAR